ncbi:MAG TPA: exosortase [Pyrinomonadaceae bacterium]|nr:exosortase [Pyrinomonadaceae bacterium]
MNQDAYRQLWRPALVMGCLAFVYASVLGKLGGQWWTDENYSHGLLIPFIIGYILWSERERLETATKRPSLVWGGALACVALLMLLAGTAGAELFMQRTSLVVMLAGITLYFWGWHILRLALVPLLLLALAIPIPAIIFNQIAFPLQLFASRCAVWAMRAFDIPVLRQGNIIELMPLNSSVTKKLEVVEACSGIRSLMTLLTLAVVFAYFTHPRGPGQQGGGLSARLKRFGTWRSAILVLSAVPIAIITNAGRVSGTGILARYYGTEVADGFFHEFSGWVVYIVAFLLLFALGWVLDKFGRRGRPPQQPRASAKTTDAAAATEAARAAHEPGDAPLVGATAATPAAAMSLREGGAGGS